MAAKKKPAPEEFRSDALAQERQDIAAAVTLRHGITVVPFITPGDRDNLLDRGEVWT